MQQISETDKALVERCRDGNLHDFRKLVENTSPFAFSVAFRILGNYDDSEDVVQETMITLWKSLKKIKSADSFLPWLYRIVINKCYDKLRKNRRNPEKIADEKTWAILSNKLSENPGNRIESEEMGQIINLFTDKLSTRQRTVFILSEIEEMPSDEISFVTGMSKMNIKSNLHYARKKIRGMIEKHL